jgi:DNA-binding FrmR family transcriptional regulator
MENLMYKVKGPPHSSEITKLKRIEGQVRGIIKMVEEERYCMDIINQLKAVRSALASVEKNIIDKHLNHCVLSAIKSGNQAETQEVMDEIKTLIRSVKP